MSSSVMENAPVSGIWILCDMREHVINTILLWIILNICNIILVFVALRLFYKTNTAQDCECVLSKKIFLFHLSETFLSSKLKEPLKCKMNSCTQNEFLGYGLLFIFLLSRHLPTFTRTVPMNIFNSYVFLIITETIWIRILVLWVRLVFFLYVYWTILIEKRYNHFK